MDMKTIVACDQKLIEELRAKLKDSVKTILDKNKEIDRLNEELQLSQLKYDNLEAAIKREAASRMNRSKSDD